MDVVFHRSLLPRGSPESTDSSEGGVQNIGESKDKTRELSSFSQLITTRKKEALWNSNSKNEEQRPIMSFSYELFPRWKAERGDSFDCLWYAKEFRERSLERYNVRKLFYSLPFNQMTLWIKRLSLFIRASTVGSHSYASLQSSKSLRTQVST